MQRLCWRFALPRIVATTRHAHDDDDDKQQQRRTRPSASEPPEPRPPPNVLASAQQTANCYRAPSVSSCLWGKDADAAGLVGPTEREVGL